MTSVDLGMFGLDCFVTDKNSSSLDSDLCIEEFENLLQDNTTQNILDMSLQESGIIEEPSHHMDTLQVCFWTSIKIVKLGVQTMSRSTPENYKVKRNF